MHDQAYCLSDSTEDSLPFEVCIEVVLASDVSGLCHVTNYLVNALNYGIGLGIASGNDLASDTILCSSAVATSAANSLPLSIRISVGHG